jgi:hypothetical protein
MMRRIASLAFALAAVASPLAAQGTHPDFTGKWVLDPASAQGPMVPTSMTISVVQDAKTIKMESAATTTMGDQKANQTVNLDGTPRKNTIAAQGMDLELTSTTAWDGPTLVITTKADIQGQPLEQIDRWSLDADGKTLSMTRNASIAGQTMSVKLAFKKS